MYSNKYSKLDRILFESQCNKSEINICTVFAPIQCNIACWKGCHLVKMVFLEAGDRNTYPLSVYFGISLPCLPFCLHIISSSVMANCQLVSTVATFTQVGMSDRMSFTIYTYTLHTHHFLSFSAMLLKLKGLAVAKQHKFFRSLLADSCSPLPCKPEFSDFLEDSFVSGLYYTMFLGVVAVSWNSLFFPKLAVHIYQLA